LDELLPQAADAEMRPFVEVEMALIQTEQRHLGGAVDLLEGLCDDAKAIDKPITVEPCMTQYVGDVEGAQRRDVVADWRFARQLQEDMGRRKIIPDQFEHDRGFLDCAARQLCCVPLRRLGMRGRSGDKGRSDLMFNPLTDLRRR
jgi:hypothetical protein